MVETKYANAYREIIEIFKYFPKEDIDKIPESKMRLFQENENKDYDFKYDPSKTLEEQNVSELAKDLIVFLFRDYMATEEQRNKILAKQRYDEDIAEKEKNEHYNPDTLFERVNSSNQASQKVVEEPKQVMDLVDISTIKWYKRFWNFLKNIFIKK